MSETIHANWYFAIPIYERELADYHHHREALVDLILALRGASHGVRRSNQGGWHSEDELHRHNHPAIAWLTREILATARAALHEPLKQSGAGQIALTQSWANINERYDWNAPHEHLPADWSGVFYVQSGMSEPPADGDCSGQILFFNPVTGPPQRQATTLNYTPRDGLLLLFPSWLLHMVAPHPGSQPRISISFNLQFVATATS